MTNPTITPGTKVRFTANRLGLVKDPHQRGFEPEVANKGDEGVYESVHPNSVLSGADWHLIKVGELYAPVHREHFEVI